VSTIVGNSVSLLTPSQLKDTQMIQLIGKQTTMTSVSPHNSELASRLFESRRTLSSMFRCKKDWRPCSKTNMFLMKWVSYNAWK